MKRTLIILGTIIPLLTFAGTVALWIDPRYMHKQISDTRFIDVQIRIVESNIRDFERIEESRQLTPGEKNDLDVEKDQLGHLYKQRQKMLGLGK
jgi:hypothetical protein